MDITSILKTIKENVASDNLAEAIEVLKTFVNEQGYYNEVVIQSARYRDIEHQIRMNVVTKPEAEQELNKIRLAILQIADEIHNHIIKSAMQQEARGRKESIKIDDRRNIIFRDTNGGTITVNYTNEKQLESLLTNRSDEEILKLKQEVANADRTALAQISSVQENLDQQKTARAIEEYSEDLNSFFAELAHIKIKALKQRILKNYSLLHEYEDLLVLEVDPIRKERYRLQLGHLRANIEQEEKEMETIINQD